MIKHITSTGLIMGGAFFLSMLTTLLLGNIMTAEEFGDFALLKNFVLIGATFSIFGLDQGNVRRRMDLTAAMVMAGSGCNRVADGDTLPCRTETFRGL